MILFLSLILVHLLYDFHWQGQFVADNKGKYPFVMFIHSLTWALCLFFVLYLFGITSYFALIFWFVTHFAIDDLKCMLISKYKQGFWTLYLDQFLHLITIIVPVLMIM